MKNLFKASLLVLLFGIVIGTVATSGKNQNTENTQLVSTINKFEEDIKNENVVEDGIINSSQNEVYEDTGNALANIFQSIGNGVVNGIGAVLKLISSLFSSFIG